MRIAVLIARILTGLIFVVFGLNGFFHFIPMGPMPTGLALVCRELERHAEHLFTTNHWTLGAKTTSGEDRGAWEQVARAVQLMAAVGELCVDLHGRGLWDAADAELLEAVWRFRRDFEAATVGPSRQEAEPNAAPDRGSR